MSLQILVAKQTKKRNKYSKDAWKEIRLDIRAASCHFISRELTVSTYVTNDNCEAMWHASMSWIVELVVVS